MRDNMGSLEAALAGMSLGTCEKPGWRVKVKVELFHGDVSELDRLLGRVLPFQTIEREGNILTAAGALDLCNGLVTSGLATPYTTTNAQLVIGDASTAALVTDTDMGAAVGTKLNAADVSSASNATPIVIVGTYSPVPVAGQVVVCSGFTGAGGAAANGTFELSAASASSITLLNSAGTGSITVTGALVKPVNKYRQSISAVTVGPTMGTSITGATNATPIVVTTSTNHGLADGMVVVIASVGGNTNANTTCYVKVTGNTATTFGLYTDKALTAGVAGNSGYTSGGTVVLKGFQMAATFSTANGNFQWNEWGICTGGAATNKQATLPPTLLNHAITNLLTKTSSASAVFTVNVGAN